MLVFRSARLPRDFIDLFKKAKEVASAIGETALYKNKHNNKYYLVISKSSHTPEEFNKVCNIISEYGQQQNLSVGSDAYFTEHYSSVILKNALSTLQQL